MKVVSVHLYITTGKQRVLHEIQFWRILQTIVRIYQYSFTWKILTSTLYADLHKINQDLGVKSYRNLQPR
jgi:hypothetical protein